MPLKCTIYLTSMGGNRCGMAMVLLYFFFLNCHFKLVMLSFLQIYLKFLFLLLFYLNFLNTMVKMLLVYYKGERHSLVSKKVYCSFWHLNGNLCGYCCCWHFIEKCLQMNRTKLNGSNGTHSLKKKENVKITLSTTTW